MKTHVKHDVTPLRPTGGEDSYLSSGEVWLFFYISCTLESIAVICIQWSTMKKIVISVAVSKLGLFTNPLNEAVEAAGVITSLHSVIMDSLTLEALLC